MARNCRLSVLKFIVKYSTKKFDHFRLKVRFCKFSNPLLRPTQLQHRSKSSKVIKLISIRSFNFGFFYFFKCEKSSMKFAQSNCYFGNSNMVLPFDLDGLRKKLFNYSFESVCNHFQCFLQQVTGNDFRSIWAYAIRILLYRIVEFSAKYRKCSLWKWYNEAYWFHLTLMCNIEGLLGIHKE